MKAIKNDANRESYDYYPTPRPFLELLAHHEDLTCESFLEPAAGDGRITLFVNFKEAVLVEIDRDKYDNLETKPNHPTWRHCGDFLTLNIIFEPDLVVTNPPYKNNIHLKFVMKCLDMVKDGGRVIMLLPVNFLNSEKRAKFNRTAPLEKYYPIVERPRFKKGSSAMVDYAWYVWKKGFEGDGVVKVISLRDIQPKSNLNSFGRKTK